MHIYVVLAAVLVWCVFVGEMRWDGLMKEAGVLQVKTVTCGHERCAPLPV